MKFPLSWIKEYVEIDHPLEKIVEDLQFSGTKIDSLKNVDGDTIFDFEITPNRADCFGVIGISREIAAIYDKNLNLPTVFSVTNPTKKRRIEFNVEESTLCPNYSIGIMGSVNVEESPKWLREHLEKSGIRTINNIVDITNFVMLETAQPMHAFDFDKVRGKMNLRLSKQNEVLTTIDGTERKLPVGSIIIEDEEKIIDLAGLMGGKASEIDRNSKTIILHAPVYNPLTIRKTSQKLSLRTEASGRFEKTLDPAGHRFAFERAAELVRTLSGGSLDSEIKSVGLPLKERIIELPLSLISITLGINLDDTQIEKLLGRLGFSTSLRVIGNEKILMVGVPSFRTDVKEPVDLTEEVGRMYGYNNFPKTLPTGFLPKTFESDLFSDTKLKSILVALGLNEIYGNPLTSASELNELGLKTEDSLKVSNRLVVDYEYLRPTLLVSLVAAAKQNIEKSEAFSFFELGRIFKTDKGTFGLPAQPKKIAALFAGSNFTSMKGVAETMLNKINIRKVRFIQYESTPPFGEIVSLVLAGSERIGVVGQLSPKYLSKLDNKESVFAFEFDLEKLISRKEPVSYKEILKYPTVKEDISLFVPKNVSFEDIVKSIKDGAGSNFYSLEFMEETLIKGKHSILVGVEYYDKNQTLSKESISKIREKVVEYLRKIGAQPRTS